MNQTMRVNNMPPNLNKYRNMHFHLLDKEKKEWEKTIYVIAREQKIQPIRNKVTMTYEFHFKTRVRHDPDNYACCAKFIQDGLVSAGILIDDSFEYVSELRIKQGDYSKHPYIEIRLEEGNEAESRPSKG